LRSPWRTPKNSRVGGRNSSGRWLQPGSAQPQELFSHHMPVWRQSQKQLGHDGDTEVEGTATRPNDDGSSLFVVATIRYPPSPACGFLKSPRASAFSLSPSLARERAIGLLNAFWKLLQVDNYLRREPSLFLVFQQVVKLFLR
jgi:hypothetical protein